MVIQKGTHVCLIHATTKDSVQFQDQVSIVRVPLVGRVKDAKVGTKKIQTETFSLKNNETTSKKLGEHSFNCCPIYVLRYGCLKVWMSLSISQQSPSVWVNKILLVKTFREQVGDPQTIPANHPAGPTRHHCFIQCFRLFNGWQFCLCLSKHLVYLIATGGSQNMGLAELTRVKNGHQAMSCFMRRTIIILPAFYGEKFEWS